MKNILSDEWWVGAGLVLTGAVGGFIGWIKQYESSSVEQPLSLRAWAMARRMAMGGFVGFLIYQLCKIYLGLSPWGFIASGLLGVFAAEALDVGWFIVKQRVAVITKTPPPDPPRKDPPP